ncbi:MAG TPA: DUF4097 family beta strand repeat-containing protein [Saprospiraceae bacterium]|nr:DUF4097 family beta strand repeat-containing protein [Saprospiraceae bacterium]
MKCNVLLLLLLIPFLAIAGPKGEEVKKTINREFNIQSNGHLGIENKYGDLDIAIGEPNKIKFNITITSKAGSEKKAQEALDRVKVSFNEGFNRVDAKTDIESSSSWLSWFGSSNQELRIDYQVLVPKDVYLELNNKYGSIFLESSDRDATVDIAYGDIRLGDINANLKLDMSYSDGSMSQIKQGDLVLRYSNLEMENSQSLTVDMQYAELVMGSSVGMHLVSSYSNVKGVDVDEVNYSGKYDDVYFDRVKKIDADCGYTGIELNGLAQSGEFDMRYGDLKISNISNGFTRLGVTTSYTGVEFEFDSNASFSLDAQTNYCDISHSDMKISESIERDASNTLKASRGSGGGQVIARMNYGGLTIN